MASPADEGHRPRRDSEGRQGSSRRSNDELSLCLRSGMSPGATTVIGNLCQFAGVSRCCRKIAQAIVESNDERDKRGPSYHAGPFGLRFVGACRTTWRALWSCSSVCSG